MTLREEIRRLAEEASRKIYARDPIGGTTGFELEVATPIESAILEGVKLALAPKYGPSTQLIERIGRAANFAPDDFESARAAYNGVTHELLKELE